MKVNLHTHFHTIALDGVYADPEETGTPRFFALSPVSDDEVPRVTATVATRVVALLSLRGLLEDDVPAVEDPVLCRKSANPKYEQLRDLEGWHGRRPQLTSGTLTDGLSTR